ncbi:alpha/beta hydrolase fold domain-containing protein [Roseiconus lacunae]|uniref:alpha/beta hydrolase fold domain-containing protein n=1 Tax=Roseiconus lacunae TaxID=2605694 RepID=UPI0011F290B5|nr:alpha/beta hydrolase fold domain-containing protein [Roseiconus lacunae]
MPAFRSCRHLIGWLTLGLSGCVAVPVLAQQQIRRPSFDQVLKREDKNSDGKISQQEFKGPARLFERLDRDNDGAVTRDEFLALRQNGQSPDRAGRSNGRQGNNARGPQDVTVHRDVVYGTGGGRDLKLHIVVPKKESDQPRPVYVWIHGGGWQGGTKEGGVGKVVPLVREGFVGATIEYRLTGEAPFPAQIEDCKCAIRFLRAHAEKYNLDPKRIAVGGSSAGGHLVALLGTSGGNKDLEGDGGWLDQSSEVQAVVNFFGPTDFKRFVTTEGYERHNLDGSPESKLLGGGEVLANPAGIKRVNPITYIDDEDPPFLIIHGTKDKTVPANQSEALAEALSNAKVPHRLHLIAGAGHGGPEFGKPEINAMVKQFLLSNLKPNETESDSQ